MTNDSGVWFISVDNGDEGHEWMIAKLDTTDTSFTSKYHTTVTSLLLGKQARLSWSDSAVGQW